MTKIAVVGSCMIDLSCFAPRLPKCGETVHGSSFKQDFGGKGANQCVAATRLGAETALIACLGDDFFGTEYKKYLAKSGVNTQHVTVHPTQSGVAQISVADNGDNQIIIVAGANNCLGEQNIQQASDVLISSKVIVFQFEIPLETTVFALKYCKEINPNGITIVNAAPAIESLDKELFKYTDILCVNETEAQVMTGSPTSTLAECEVAAKKLLLFGSGTVIVTLGKEGAMFVSHEDHQVKHERGRIEHHPVDTVGAGDVFIGSLAYLLAYRPHWSMGRKVSVSCHIAAASITKKGTQASFPYLKDLPPSLLQD